MKKKIIFLLFIFFAVNLFAQTDTALTFNEIMFNTDSGTNSEFIELYNTSVTDTIDLNNFKFKYRTSSTDIFISAGFGTKLPPGKYAVIFEGDYNLSSGIYNGLVPSSALVLKLNNNAFGSSGMANTSSRQVILMNLVGDTLDTYIYSANNSKNISDEKITTNKDNSSSNWSNSTKTNGTPGFRNSVTPLSFDLVLLSLTTSPTIKLEGNNINITATAKNTGTQTAGSYSIEIFNDTNFDSVGTSSERIFNQSFSNLAANDSVSVSTSITNPSVGINNLIAKVLFSNDEDTTNNTKISLVTVFPILHQFNDIVVNEIMHSPSSGQTEWVELYNRTDSSVNLNGWTFSDNNKTVTFTNNDVNIPSNSFLVLSKDSSILNNYSIPVQLIVFNNMPSLNNSGDAVVIKDSLGILVDSLTYTAAWGGSSGNSLERIDVNDSSTKQSNWGTSISNNKATPGVKNSLTPFNNDLALTSFTHSPQLIIEGNNVNLSSTVKNIGKNTASSFTFSFYNDTDFDNIGTVNERIFTQNYSNLTKSDSINVNFTFNPLAAGDYNFIAEIDFTLDENTSNNKRLDNFTVIREPNTFNNLVVNEIMYAPPSSQSEWIEIYNRSDSSVNIKNWKIADNLTTVNITKNDFILAAKSFVVLSSDASLLNVFNNSINLLVIPNIPSLNNSGDAIVLHDSLGLKIDSLSYLSSWGGNAGKSLERISVNDSSTKQSNWGTSININGATPSLRNSVTPFNNDLSVASFNHFPQFIIEGNNVDFSATIKNIGKNTASSFTFNIYNDVNNDNIGTANERIFTKNYTNLAKSDSINVSVKYLPPSSGNYRALAEIIFVADEDTSNNKSVDNFTVIKETNAFNNIVINEIMYAPVSGKTEWVELYNRTDSSVNIKGWTFADNKTTVTLTNNNINFPSKSFIVVSKDSTVLSSYNVPVQLVVFSNMPSLNNSGDAVVVKDSIGVLIDSLSYTSSWGGNSGKSLERIDVNDSSTRQSNWGTSININGATPGVRNSITPFDNDLSVTSFNHSPQFIIEGNNVNFSATVKNIGKNAAPSFTFNLYNDINNDNVGTANERIFTQNYANLAKSDSVNISTNYLPPLFGNYKILAEIIFATDENTSNNKRLDNFTVIREPNTFNNLVVNEIMYAPPSNQSEWIEIYNRSNSSINIKNWKIADNLTTVNITKNDFILAAKSFVILSSDSSLLNVFNNSINLLVIPNIPSLNNSGDAVVLHDSLGLKIDSLSYISSWGGNAGKSLERISVNISSTKGSNWGNSISNEGATPGIKNSLTPFDYDLSITFFSHSPDLILEGKGIRVTLKAIVKNIGKNTASSFVFNFYNDSNFDNIGTANEIIFNQNYSNLIKSDSIIIFTELTSLTEGNYNIIAKINFSSDEDVSNNKSIDSFTVIREPNTYNNLIINEIMYAPPTGQSEWVEIYNRSDSSVNLKSWEIHDNSTKVKITKDDFILASKDFVVFSTDSSLLNIYKKSINLLVIPNLPSLNNSGDRVALNDSLGKGIDILNYNSSWGGENGKSLERIDSEVRNTLQSNWGTSVSPAGATPGEINSLTQKDFNIRVIDIIFTPDKPLKGDNVGISTIVNNSGKNTVQYSLQLYEMTNADIFPGVLVETKNNLSINTGESKTETFNFQITNLQNDRVFVVKALLITDQDTTDNQKQKIITPGYRQSTIVINEIMYTPIGGEPEWIELYNSSTDSINLSNWSITDRFATPVTVTINANVFIQSKSYLVIARDSSISNYHKAIPSKLVILNLPGLNNNTDGVVLRDNRNLTIDSVLYNSSWGGTSGYSLERKDFSVGSNLAGNWSSSNDNEISTPGRINSITNRQFDLKAVEISFSPQFPVTGDNVTPSLKIINKGQSNANNFSIQFFIDSNSDNIPDQLLSTETGLNLAGFDSAYVSSSTDIENLQQKVLVGVNIIFSQDEDTLNNYAEALTQPGFAHNSMLINEIMYAPETGQTEWIELINNSNEAVSLKNWSVSDILPSPTKNFITNSDFIINPDEYLILTKDSSFFSLYPNVTSVVKLVNFGSLGNSSDGIIIYDFRDAKIDSLLYSSNWGGSKGFSIERISTDNPTNDSTNWTTSLSVNHSTPGFANSIKNITLGNKGELVINEIMYNPGDGNSEFVEFYNNSSNDVNIGGWQITDENGNSFKLSQTSLIIQPDSYFLLSADSSIINNYDLSGQNLTIINSSSLGLSNSGELILLTDFLGYMIDSVHYSDKWNNDNFTDTKNKSLERINPSINGNDKNNWSTSVIFVGATPAKQNSIFTEKLQTQSRISISPNPFSPDNDGFEDFTIISFNLTQPIAQVKVKIYNSQGRLVRTLDNNLASGSSGSIIFNGLDDDGNPLRMGIYIVYLEALNQNAGVTEALKAALVVARKLN